MTHCITIRAFTQVDTSSSLHLIGNKTGLEKSNRSRSKMRLPVTEVFAIILAVVTIFHPVDGKDPWLYDTGNLLSSVIEITSDYSELRWRIDGRDDGCPREMGKWHCYMLLFTKMIPVLEQFLIRSKLHEEAPNRGAMYIYYNLHSMKYDNLPDLIKQKFLDSPSLKRKYNSDFVRLVGNLIDDVYPVTQKDPSLQKSGYVFPLKRECAKLPTRNVPALLVKNVCPTLSNCAISFYSSSTNACGENNKCDVEKAIPLMIGVIWYKIIFAIVDKFCPDRCSGENGCDMQETLDSIAKQVDMVKNFLSMLPLKQFDHFYKDALTRRAYSQIGEAMKIISENEENFSRAGYACREIKAPAGCEVMEFYSSYLLLKKLKNERLQKGNTRDLTLHENVDHAKIIQLKHEAIKHTQVLSAIDQLNKNMEAHVKGISSYFQGIAKFDQGIANADVAFIGGKLDEFNNRYTALQNKVKDDVKAAMIAMTSLLSIQLVEETVALVTKILEESNPISVIFTGVDTKGIRDQAKVVADTAAKLAHGITLVVKLGELATDTEKIGTDLQDNRKQLASLKTMVNKIKSNSADTIGDDAEEFIENYSNYQPKVDRQRMRGNIALWGAFKDSTCDLLQGVQGIAGSTGKAVANGFLLCEKLEGTIAEFDALRENIFEFQFELVDSLSRVVRGNVAKKLAASIGRQTNDMFKAHQLLGGFLMTQLFIQSQAFLYCDKLEYRNEGQTVGPCSPESGLFTNSDLDNLVAFTDHRHYISIERTVHIPSRPQYSGDLGFINVYTLATNKTVSFRLPQNLTWLYQFDWSLIGESHAAYVENFQLFLPNKEYKTGSEKVKTSTRIVLTAETETGSFISANTNNSVLYKLPERQTSYVTVYQEGYRSSTCSNEIPNPYSLCNNLPKICHTTSNVAGDSLLPTTLSRWRVTLNVQSGGQKVEWKAPNSTTDLYLIAKVTLRMLPRKSLAGSRSSVPTSPPDDVCCQGNTYRASLVSSTCEKCPDESTARLGGYYCEAKPSTPGGKKHRVFQRKDSPKHGLFTKRGALPKKGAEA